MDLSKVRSWLDLKEGDRPFESGKFQLLWAVYLATLAVALMLSADTRGGGYGGFSYRLVGVVLVFGFTVGILAKHRKNTVYQTVLAFLSGAGFWALINIGALLFPLFGYHGEGPTRPFEIATVIYSVVPFVIFGRLQRPISAPLNDDDSYSPKLFQIYFDNNWRISQAILSLTAIIVVGVFLPLGTLMTQRQNIHLLPLAIFVGGLLSGFLVLALQFIYEIRFLEKSYEEG